MRTQNPQPGDRDPANLLQVKPYEDFLVLCKSSHTKENYHQDLRVLKQFLEDSGITTPEQAKPEHMVRFAGSLTKPGTTPRGKARGPYSTRSMKRILATTRSFYRFLASIQRVSNDPTAVFHNLSIRSPQRNPHPLPKRDRDALVLALRTEDPEDLKVSLVVLLGYHCGLRVSEIAHLQIRDLDLAEGIVSIIGKGDKERQVPMTKPLVELLRGYCGAPEAKDRGPYLFPSPRSPQKPIHPDYLETWVKRAASWAGLEDAEGLTVHVLRHSFGTQLAESGASVYEIRDLMGHSSIVVSESYVKLASTKARQAHGKAFGAGMKVHAVHLTPKGGPEEVLRRSRSRSRKALKDRLEEP